MYKYKRYDTTFTDRSSLVKIDAFRVIVVTDTARPPARRPPVLPPQTGLITIHCAAMLSVQCKTQIVMSLNCTPVQCRRFDANNDFFTRKRKSLRGFASPQSAHSSY